MAGGYHTRRQQDRDRTLAQRVSADADPQPPTPCWIRWPDDGPIPGHILQWHRDDTGRWWALVVVRLAGESVTPRQPDPDPSDRPGDLPGRLSP